MYASYQQAQDSKASSPNAVAALSQRSGGNTLQKKTASVKPNHTGMPDQLKSGIENLSGFSMDDVKVHYNSSRPAQLNALAYAQGTDIHIAPGQEKHLPHEAWHVVQQKEGRVRPTMQMKDVAINDDKGLEREADVMGELAIQTKNLNGQGFESRSGAVNQNLKVAQTKKTKPFKVEGKYATKVAKYSEYKDLKPKKYNKFIFDRLEEIYDGSLAKGKENWKKLKSAIEEFNAEGNKGFLKEQKKKHKEYNSRFEKNYINKIEPDKGSEQTLKVNSFGLANKKDRIQENSSIPYANRINFEDNSITAKHNFAAQDRARVKDNEKKGEEGYKDRGLPNSEILWQQYKLAVRSQFKRKKDSQSRELMKGLSVIKRREIQNTSTQMTLLFALPNKKTSLEDSYVWKAESEEFQALLGTPNCSGAAFLLKDHVDDLDGKSITEIELLGGKDVNLDIKIG